MGIVLLFHWQHNWPTFPFSIYYFNQFPTYAWLSNFIVIPAAFIFIYLSVVVLLFSPIPIISSTLGKLISILIHQLYSLLSGFKYLPNYVIEDIFISNEQLFILLLILVSLMLFIAKRNARHIIYILSLFCVFIFMNILRDIRTVHQKEIIIYNAGNTKLIHLIDGKKNYLLSDSPMNEKTDYLIKAVQLNMNLDPPTFISLNQCYESANLFISPHIILFHGYCILYNPNFLFEPADTNRCCFL